MGRPKKAIATSPTTIKLVEERPSMTSQEWNDWVLDQLRDDEKDPQGNPMIDGLRRLVEDLLGDVIKSYPTVVEGAKESNGYRASVEHHVVIAWGRNHDDLRHYGAAADVYPGNTDDEYARYPTATADTRAEGRALRKALRLRRVVTAEEITAKPVHESGLDKLIVDSQIKGINKLCKDLDIDAVAFVNMGKNSYAHFTHVRYESALAMLEQLNRYLQDDKKIPASIKGYKPNWRNTTKEES
jgi:hypothetical protein